MIALPGRFLRWIGRVVRLTRREWLYEDHIVKMDAERLVIRRYYWPLGPKRIPYSKIKRISPRPLKAWHGQFRVHGIDFKGRWYSHDRHRGEKETAIDLSIGNLLRPSLTPDDPALVLEILERLASHALEAGAGSPSPHK